jgi:radical SAM-linked protein
MTATKVRLRFAKHGDLRLVSHHDLMRCLERMLRRARLPIAQSQGFNPRPKVVFTLALALGIEGRREVLELDLAEPLEPVEVLRRLAAVAPPGFDWLEAEAVAPGRPAQAEAVAFLLEIPADRQDAARARLATLLASPRWPYTRHRPDRDRDVAIDLRPFVLGAEIDPLGVLRFRLKMTPGGSARPDEVLDALGLRDLLERGAVLVRTDVELAPELRWAPAVTGPETSN